MPKKKPKDHHPPNTPYGLAFEWFGVIEELAAESDRGAALMGYRLSRHRSEVATRKEPRRGIGGSR